MDISLLFPLLILLLFIPIFLSGRKQRRQMQEMQQLQKSLEPGDVVVTTSGLRGTVVDASYEDTIDIEIADGVVTTWVRAAVREKVAVPAEESTARESGAESDTASGAASSRESSTEPDTPALEKEKDDSPNGTSRS
jgi:preprotein translocase subunit YajC